MHYVGMPKIDDGIAIGVRRLRMVNVNFLPVEAQRQAVGVRQNGKRPGRRSVFLLGHPLAHVLVRNNHRAQLGHGFVALGMIAMQVRVHQVADGLRADLANRIHDLLMHGSIHGVDQKQAIGPRRYDDVALRRTSHQHVQAVRNFDRLDLGPREIHALRRSHCGGNETY
jgi:hypothetical protein